LELRRAKWLQRKITWAACQGGRPSKSLGSTEGFNQPAEAQRSRIGEIEGVTKT